MMIELTILFTAYIFLGYHVARPKSIISLLITLWLWFLSIYFYIFVSEVTLSRLFPPDNTLFMTSIEWFIALIFSIIIYGLAFGIGYYIGKIVNNVEKYQRK